MSNMVGKKWNMGWGSARRNSAVCCLKIFQLSNPWHWDDYLARQNLHFCSFCKALLASEDSTPVITETANSVRTDDTHVLKSIQVKSCFWTCYHLLYHILLTSSYIIYHISYPSIHIKSCHIIATVPFTACSKSCLPGPSPGSPVTSSCSRRMVDSDSHQDWRPIAFAAMSGHVHWLCPGCSWKFLIFMSKMLWKCLIMIFM